MKKLKQLSSTQIGDVIYIKENLTNIIAVKIMEYQLKNSYTEVVFLRSDNKKVDTKFLSNNFYHTIDDAVNDKPISVNEYGWEFLVEQLQNNGYEVRKSFGSDCYDLILYYPNGCGQLNKTSISLGNIEVMKYQWYDISDIDVSFQFYDHWEMNKVGYYKSIEEFHQKNPYQVYTF
jgi:hypothetical protein